MNDPLATRLRIGEAESLSFGKKFSIIIPAYNEEDGIVQTLESLCAEDWLDGAEIIVVDDGSSDKTCAIASAFPDVKIIRHPFNRGYG